jgi:hypothetical protein
LRDLFSLHVFQPLLAERAILKIEL